MTPTHTLHITNFVVPHPGSRVKDSFLGSMVARRPQCHMVGSWAGVVRSDAQSGLKEKQGTGIQVGVQEKGQRTKRGNQVQGQVWDETRPWEQGAGEGAGNGRFGRVGVLGPGPSVPSAAVGAASCGCRASVSVPESAPRLCPAPSLAPSLCAASPAEPSLSLALHAPPLRGAGHGITV